jgi:hypothetical protein
MPTWNGEPFVVEALQSVLAQVQNSTISETR